MFTTASRGLIIPTLQNEQVRPAPLCRGPAEVAELVFHQFCPAPKPVSLLLLPRCLDSDFMEQKHFQTNGGRRETYMKLPTILLAAYGYSEKTTTDKTAFTNMMKRF